MSTDCPQEPGPVPRKVKVVDWRPIAVLTLVSLFMMPHTISGVFLGYFAVAETIHSLTGLRLPMPAGMDNQASLILLWLFVICWNAMLVTVWVITWQGFFLEYRLLKWGTATVGRVTNKRTSVSGTIAHGIRYEIDFDHSCGTGTMVVNQRFFEAASIGDVVRICYDPTRPASSILVDGCFVFGVR